MFSLHLPNPKLFIKDLASIPSTQCSTHHPMHPSTTCIKRYLVPAMVNWNNVGTSQDITRHHMTITWLSHDCHMLSFPRWFPDRRVGCLHTRSSSATSAEERRIYSHLQRAGICLMCCLATQWVYVASCLLHKVCVCRAFMSLSFAHVPPHTHVIRRV